MTEIEGYFDPIYFVCKERLDDAITLKSSNIWYSFDIS